MKKTSYRIPAEYVVPLNMNGLKGRMLRLPSQQYNNKEILFIYGHHPSIERVYGFAELLSDYGNVTIPDMPGFGGMDSFYRLKEKPSLDILADYMASFVKLRYRNKKLVIVGFSFGFLVATRMLQRNPALVDKVEMLISLSGFCQSDDLKMSSRSRLKSRLVSRFLSLNGSAKLFRGLVLRPVVIKNAYKHTKNARDKLSQSDPEKLRLELAFESWLWRLNDVRTHMFTTSEMMKFDSTNQKVDINLWHVAAKNDRYVDNQKAIDSLKKVYTRVYTSEAKSDNHSPSIMASRKDVTDFFPAKLRNALKRNAKKKSRN